MANHTSLKSDVLNEKVRYALNVGQLIIRSETTQIVQLTNGQYVSNPVPGIVLEREGGRNEYGTTRAYDPKNPRDAEIIAAVDEFLELHPNYRTDIRVQLNRVGEFDPVKPYGLYDNTDDLDQMKQTLLALESHLPSVMKYELSKEEPRDEVIKLLNSMAAEQRRQVKDTASKQAVEL